MWGKFNVGNSYVKSRPPTTIRIELDLLKRRLTAQWEILQIKKEIVFPMAISGDDVWDVFSVAQAAIQALEQIDVPYRSVDGDTLEIWQILEDGEPYLFATVAVSVTPLICSECDLEGGRHAN